MTKRTTTATASRETEPDRNVPAGPQPSLETLEEWMLCDGVCECIGPCACWVEPDGTCPNGYVSWLVHLLLI